MPIWFDATTKVLINPPVIGIPRVDLIPNKPYS